MRAAFDGRRLAPPHRRQARRRPPRPTPTGRPRPRRTRRVRRRCRTQPLRPDCRNATASVAPSQTCSAASGRDRRCATKTAAPNREPRTEHSGRPLASVSRQPDSVTPIHSIPATAPRGLRQSVTSNPAHADVSPPARRARPLLTAHRQWTARSDRPGRGGSSRGRRGRRARVRTARDRRTTGSTGRRQADRPLVRRSPVAGVSRGSTAASGSRDPGRPASMLEAPAGWRVRPRRRRTRRAIRPPIGRAQAERSPRPPHAGQRGKCQPSPSRTASAGRFTPPSPDPGSRQRL